MALARTRRGESGMNYWPGFVDALSTLILSIIFLLSVFVVVQFYLQQEVQGQSAALQRLNAQITGLAEQLSMAKSDKADLEGQLAGLQASLAGTQSDRDKFQALYRGAAADAAAAQGKVKELSDELTGTQSDRDKYQALYQGAAADATAAQSKASALSGQLSGERDISANALAQVETLNTQLAALRQQLAALNTALGASEQKDAQSQQKITDLGQRLNVALAKDVQELSSYRSDFFGKLRTILGNRPDIRVVGDRFVLQSEVFFDTSRADLKPEGRAELDKVAGAIVELEGQIPPDIAWVLRVDGHTDVRPISGGQFKSNWDLSAARALAVVQYLIDKGVQPDRLVGAAFGQYDPIDTGATEDAYRRNRRIEFKLTER
ncbi:MAG: peptidoglycan -binding protein [Xanthobacteraceae bacterium]